MKQTASNIIDIIKDFLWIFIPVFGIVSIGHKTSIYEKFVLFFVFLALFGTLYVLSVLVWRKIRARGK